MSRDEISNSSSSLSETLTYYRARIDRALFAELQRRETSPFFAPFVNALAGGKRLRSTILLLAFESVGGRECDPLPAAVAVELAHMESLVHDDIIDGDITRRGSMSFHTSYGREMALLSADFILALILSITSRYSDPRVANTLATATISMCEGELLEVNAFAAGPVIQTETYVEIITKKTAVLFEAAASIGAVVGGATHADIERLSAYARALGIAYQVRDDLTDGIQSGSRSVALALSDQRCSQEEYLRQTAALHAHEACAQLKFLQSSEAQHCLTKLAMAVGFGARYRM
ncbi:MAG: polyprenyl synthetase family protein [Halobacteriota archaeon]